MTDPQKILVSAGLSALLAGGGTFAAMQRQVDKVEVRQEEQYRSLRERINEVGERTKQGHEDIKADLQGIRGEIMNILRERR